MPHIILELRKSIYTNKILLRQVRFALFLITDHILTAFNSFKETLQKTMKHVSEKMNNYLGDKKTESILLRVIRANIIDNYQTFHDVVTSEYDASLWNKIETVLGVAIMIDQYTGRKSSFHIPSNE